VVKQAVLIFICGFLLSCGSQQPSGDLDACSGDITVTEKIYDVSWSPVLYLNPGVSIGQYFRFRMGLKIKQVMVEIVSIAATSLKVSIYKTSMWNDMTSDTQPLKEYTFTTGLTPNSKHELWLELPEPFEVPATSQEDRDAGIFYFVNLEPIGGQMVMFKSPRDRLSELREGIRDGSMGSFGNTDTDKALDMGFRGEANCQSTN
jgi:hypothetical protein